MKKVEIETGCIVDGVLGIYTIQSVLQFAQALGWRGEVPTSEELSDRLDYFLDVEDDALTWLNGAIAKDDHAFGWHDGSFYYWSIDDWQSLV